MINGNKSLPEIIIRFLSPILKTPITFLRSFLIFCFRGIDGVVHVLFLERIVFFLENGNKIGFDKTLMYYFLFIIFYNIIFFLTNKYGWTETKAQFVINLQDNYIKKFVKLNNNTIETVGVGKMIAIIRSGISMWGTLIFNLFETGSYVFISVLFTIYMLGRVDISYAFIFFILYIIFHIVGIYLNEKIINSRKKRIEHKNLYTKQLVKILMSKFEILQSDKVEKEIEVLDYHMKKTIFYNKKMANPLSLFFRIPETGMTLMIIFTFLYFGNRVFNGEVSLAVLVGLSGALILMQRTINKSVCFYKDITRDFSEVEVMWDFFDNTKEIKGLTKGKKFNHKKGNIKIKDLTYSYKKGHKVFNKFSLNIEGEKILALVGNSGGGKSTLAKLISGYIRANSGDIIIDNQNLKDISLKSYYKDIGYLTQEPSVFDGTILDNLTYVIDRKITQEELDKVIKLAKCEFIYKLPNGLDTQIGERGIKLSGGQKQRLAIAKMFMKNPKIIILDEPTSALDSFSEEQITKAMHNLFSGRTVIIIAHRLQTVKNADRIIVIENGEIIEDGNHKSLMKNKGQYAKMLKLQSGF